ASRNVTAAIAMPAYKVYTPRNSNDTNHSTKYLSAVPRNLRAIAETKNTRETRNPRRIQGQSNERDLRMGTSLAIPSTPTRIEINRPIPQAPSTKVRFRASGQRHITPTAATIHAL